MNKYWQTLFNHKDRIKERMSTMFYWLEHCQWTQDEFLNYRRERIYDNPSWSKLTRNIQAYLTGVMDERMRVFLKEHTVYCVVWDPYNYKPLTMIEWESLWSDDKPWHALENCPRGTYYKNSRKPFHTSPAPNDEKENES